MKRSLVKLAAIVFLFGMAVEIGNAMAEPIGMHFNPAAELDSSTIDTVETPAPQVLSITDFPGGLSITLENGFVLTCQDWVTTGAECNSADTVQHYSNLIGA